MIKIITKIKGDSGNMENKLKMLNRKEKAWNLKLIKE